MIIVFFLSFFLSYFPGLEPAKLEVIMSIHGFVKIVECRLLQLGEDPANKIHKSDVEKVRKEEKNARCSVRVKIEPLVLFSFF